MFNVYYQFVKQAPVLIGFFDVKDYAQVLVDFGNELYTDGREFYIEEIEEEVESEYQYGYEKQTDVDKWRFIPYETRY
jgi:uncharacterized protein YqgQ